MSTFCVLVLAGILAALLTVQERLLRFNKVNGLIEKFPSLETMEIRLFQVVSCGFFLLTLVLITSFYSYHSLLSQNLVLLQKAFLVLLAWGVLLLLLIGRCYHGWRGRRAVGYTLVAALLVLAAYLFSKLVLKIL